MIILRHLLRYKAPTLHLPLTFSTQKPSTSPTDTLTSQQTLQKFKQYLQQNTQTSLQKGAQLLAALQYEVQNNQERINTLQTLLQQCPANIKDQILKIQIVMDNIKQQQEQIQAIQKRAQKEIADCKNYSVSSIAREVLEVADSLARCRKISVQYHKDDDHEVVQAIEKADRQMKLIFERYGIKQFDPTDQQYDPNHQQALSVTPAPTQKHKNKVAYTTRTGYTIKGRLLRSAHVGIYQ